MRAFLWPILSGVVCAAALGAAAGATPAMPKGSAVQAADLVLVDARCGHGWHYVPAGYARHGKWRDAHCSRN